jgi:hypothetical protein
MNNALTLSKYKFAFTISVLVLVLILIVAIISAFWPRYEERFFELGLLGREGKAEGYYPNDNSTIQIGVPILWQIYVHNHMGSAENVTIRVKIINATMTPPDDRSHEPSPFPLLTEFPVSLSVDETRLINFSWSVTAAGHQNGSTIIHRLTVNDDYYDVNISGDHFRMVYELWVYDKSTQQYRFMWESREKFYSASLYMWFDLA